MDGLLKNKKILIVLGGLAFIILLFLIIIFAFGGKKNGGTATTTDSGSPFGSATGGTRPISGGDTGSATSTNTTPEEHASLFQISDAPVVGYTTFVSAGVNFARFIDRSTGHILETGLESVHPVVVSNVTIPRVEKAEWVGNNILFQYLNDSGTSVRSFFGTLTKNADPNGLADTVTGFFIDDGSSGAALRPDGGAVFSLLRTKDGSSGVITDNTTRGRSVIFSSPLGELLVEWPTMDTIAITTKPDRAGTGILFFVDPHSGRTTQKLDGMNLSTKVDTAGTKVLYTEMKSPNDPSDRRLTMGVIGLTSPMQRTMQLTTLPEKCVWSAFQNTIVYCFVPRTLLTSDDQVAWYRGELSLSDNLWKIDTATGEVALLSLPIIDARTDIDGVEPMLSTDEKYMLFRNKKDGLLFGYRLPAPPEAPLQTGTTTDSGIGTDD